MSKTSVAIFAYDWKHYDEDDILKVNIYGRTKDGKNVRVLVDDFKPFCYVELPLIWEWTKGKIELVVNKFERFVSCRHKPLKVIYITKQKLYYSHLVKNPQGTPKYKHRKYPYLLLTFDSLQSLSVFSKACRYNKIEIGSEKPFILIPREHEYYLTPVIKICSLLNIPITGWLEITGTIIEDKESSCDIEIQTPWKNLKALDLDDKCKMKTITFDDEANSEDYRRMPDSNKKGDCIFQCSMIIDDGINIVKILISTGKTAPIEGVKIIECKDEADFLIKKTEIIVKERPNILLGYNIFGWDLKYEIDRAIFNGCLNDYLKMGYIRGKPVDYEYDKKLESKALLKNSFTYPKPDGILMIDLYPIIKKEHKLSNYRLNTVSQHFLNQSKRDISARDIFKLYAKGDPDSLSVIGDYCCQDSNVTHGTYKHLDIFTTLSEQSKVYNVPVIYLYTQGQQIKVVCQVYKYCVNNGIMYEPPDKDNTGGEYSGATVLEPFIGIHSDICLLDFASLYPSIMMAHNLCYSTLVIDQSIPDEDCFIGEYEEHKNCSHDPNRETGNSAKIICKNYRSRFIKPELVGRGILPIILQNLLKKRKEIKNRMGVIKSEITKLDKTDISKITELKSLYSVLDARQTATKLSANSLYGATGVKQGYLPCLEISSLVTKMGRENIDKARNMVMQEFGSYAIYGDTDSVFVKQNPMEYKQLVSNAIKMSERSMQIFKDPTKLEFDKVLAMILIQTKKRYLYTSYDGAGNVILKRDSKGNIVTKKDSNGVLKPVPFIDSKGVQLNRRDNTKVLKNIYSSLVEDIFMGETTDIILYNLIGYLNNVFNYFYPIEDFVLSKSITREDLTDNELKNKYREMFNKEAEFSDDKEKRAIIKEIKEVNKTAFQGKYTAKQSHIVLAERMRKRGVPVSVGSRIDYLFTSKGEEGCKQEDKIEDYEYFKRNYPALDVDRIYLFERLINPIDQILDIGLKIKGFMMNQYYIRLQKHKCLKSLKTLFAPKIKVMKKFEITFED